MSPTRITTEEQYRVLMTLGGGPSRCVGGNPCHTALVTKGFAVVRWLSRREYLLTRTQAGAHALGEWIARKARQKSTLHT